MYYLLFYYFHIKVIRPLSSWALLAPGPSSPPRPPDKVLLYSFDHYSISRTALPSLIKFYLIDKSTFLYFLLKCLKHVTFKKFLRCTYSKLHYFKLFLKLSEQVWLIDTYNKCHIKTKVETKCTGRYSIYNNYWKLEIMLSKARLDNFENMWRETCFLH